MKYFYISIILALSLTGCSSKDDSAESMAELTCEHVKDMDLVGLKEYTSKKFTKVLGISQNILDDMKRSGTEEELENYKAQYDCSNIGSAKATDLGVEFIISKIANQRAYFKEVDGKWKLVNMR